jgi:hypothetical protein
MTIDGRTNFTYVNVSRDENDNFVLGAQYVQEYADDQKDGEHKFQANILEPFFYGAAAGLLKGVMQGSGDDEQREAIIKAAITAMAGRAVNTPRGDNT